MYEVCNVLDDDRESITGANLRRTTNLDLVHGARAFRTLNRATVDIIWRELRTAAPLLHLIDAFDDDSVRLWL